MSPGTASELVRDVESRISGGELRPGDRLTPVRETAAMLGVAPNTVASAYRQLRERGVVVGRGRQGTVVAVRPTVAPVLDHGVPPGVVDAMTGNPDLALLPQMADAFAHALAQPGARYGDALLVPALADVGRSLFLADGIDAASLTAVSGAMDAIERLLQAHLRPGDRVGVEDPGYASVHQLVGALGLVPVPISIDTESILPSALADALAGGLEALILTPRSHNPTGAALTQQRAAALDAVLEAWPSTFVIEDDHAAHVAGVEFFGLGRDRPRWAVVRSVAKALGPDLRLALVAGDRATIDRVEGRLQVGPGWVSHILQRVVAHVFTDPTGLESIALAADTYRHRRQRMLERLGAHGIAASARSGLHVWVPVTDEQSVVSGTRDHGFAIRAGTAYRLMAPPAVRITTAAMSDSAIDALADALADAVDPRSAMSRIA